MISKIADGIFRIAIAIPGGGILGKVNTYIVKGSTRHLLIDTGMNIERSEKELLTALNDLGIALKDIDIFLTHSHDDHAGLTTRLTRDNTKVFINHDTDKLKAYRNPKSPHPLFNRFHWGIEQGVLKDWEIGSLYGIPPAAKVLCYLYDGDFLEYGQYKLRFIKTPGHCEDHGCLYAEEHGIIFCGDIVLDKISPSVFEGDMTEGNLNKYFKSLKAVYRLDVETVCPGHGESFDFQARIEELMQLHETRLQETFMAAKAKPSTVADLAPKLRWHFAGGDWNKFSGIKKGFAYGAVLAYLDYLCHRSIMKAEPDSSGFYRFTACIDKLPDQITDPL